MHDTPMHVIIKEKWSMIIYKNKYYKHLLTCANVDRSEHDPIKSWCVILMYIRVFSTNKYYVIQKYVLLWKLNTLWMDFILPSKTLLLVNKEASPAQRVSWQTSGEGCSVWPCRCPPWSHQRCESGSSWGYSPVRETYYLIITNQCA